MQLQGVHLVLVSSSLRFIFGEVRWQLFLFLCNLCICCCIGPLDSQCVWLCRCFRARVGFVWMTWLNALARFFAGLRSAALRRQQNVNTYLLLNIFDWCPRALASSARWLLPRYAGWQILAAETVNSENQVIWKNASQSLHTSKPYLGCTVPRRIVVQGHQVAKDGVVQLAWGLQQEGAPRGRGCCCPH